MSAWEMVVRRGDFACTLTGHYVDPEDEAPIAEMVAAMREGLEANGYIVEAKITLSTEVTL